MYRETSRILQDASALHDAAELTCTCTCCTAEYFTGSHDSASKATPGCRACFAHGNPRGQAQSDGGEGVGM